MKKKNSWKFVESKNFDFVSGEKFSPWNEFNDLQLLELFFIGCLFSF